MAEARAAMHRLSAIVGERTIFENDAYRNLWIARLLSATPANAIVYTMLILVVNAREESFYSSLFVVAYILPSALFGTLSGVIVDRMPKSLVLAGTTGVRAALCVLLAISTGSVLMIYVIAVFFAVASQFSGPAEGAALPAVVKADELTSANSVNNLGGLISQIAGLMILPAVFLKTIGPEPLAIACAGMFAAATVFFLLVEGIGGPVSAVDITLEDTRERFAEAWHRLTLDAVSYVSVVIVVVANTVGLVVVTLLPRYATQVLDVSAENAVFVATPAALGIWLALRFVRWLSAGTSLWWGIGGPFAGLLVGVALLAFVRSMGTTLEDLNPFWLFEPGPFGQDAARIIITMVLAGWLAFTFTFLNVVGRSIVNERIPRDMQGRVFAAQSVLTTLSSIPPILLTGLLADVIGVTRVFVFVSIVSAVLALFYSARNLAMPTRPAV
jgi:MFS family permease